MIKYNLGLNRHQEMTNVAEKRHKAIYIRDRIFPVLAFLKDHNIEVSEVNGQADIINHFKEQFPFPNTTPERNFELLGIDISRIANAGVLQEFNKDFYIEGNQVKIKPEWLEANTDKATYYTRTDADVKAYEYANKLMELVKEGADQGFLTSDAFISISNDNGLVSFRENEPNYLAGSIYQAGQRHEKHLQTK